MVKEFSNLIKSGFYLYKKVYILFRIKFLTFWNLLHGRKRPKGKNQLIRVVNSETCTENEIILVFCTQIPIPTHSPHWY